MTITPHDFWEKKHKVYATEAWIGLPTYFAEEVASRFPPGSRVLDLGCGQGQDSTYFTRLGHKVTAMDFSELALASFPPASEQIKIEKVSHSISDLPLPFGDGQFDVVYSHLALHYFSHEKTKDIFREVHRVLRGGGLLCVMVNSVDDPEYGEGTRIEPDFYEVNPGDYKRYFSTSTMQEFVAGAFSPQVLEQTGRTRKDPHAAFVRLVADSKDGEKC